MDRFIKRLKCLKTILMLLYSDVSKLYNPNFDRILLIVNILKSTFLHEISSIFVKDVRII